jgi:hypothetical protein
LPEVFSDHAALETWLQGFHEGNFDPEDALTDVLYTRFENEEVPLNPLDKPNVLDLVVRPKGLETIEIAFLLIGVKEDHAKMTKKYDPIAIRIDSARLNEIEGIVKTAIEKDHKEGFDYPIDMIDKIAISIDKTENETYRIMISNDFVANKKDYTKNMYAVKIRVTAKDFITFPSNLHLLSYKYNDNTYARSRYASYNIREKPDKKIIETTRVPVHTEKRYVPSEFKSDLTYAKLAKCEPGMLTGFYEEIKNKMDRKSDSLKELNERKANSDKKHGNRIKAELDSDLNRIQNELNSIKNGISLLDGDKDLMRAFRLLNKSFSIRFDNESKKKSNYTNDRWRSFQLAFLLSQITSTFKNEKTLVLINFPTGMGKTESFMGLALLKIIYERLSKTNHGTSAIIKYPRKLLSRQQLRRALELVTFANAALLEEEDIMQHPISLGTLFNSEDTPNRYVDARSGYKETTEEFQKWIREPYNRAITVSKCPYCDSDVEIKADEKTLRIKFYCKGKKCLFVEKTMDEIFERTPGEMPLYIGDDEVFRYLPSILITTIDKFSTFASNNPNFKSLILDNRIKLDSRYGFYFTDKNFKHFKECKSGKETTSDKFYLKFKAPSLFIFDEIHLVNGAYASKLSVIENAFMNLFSGAPGNLAPHIVCSSATVCQVFNDDGLFAYQSDMARLFVMDPKSVMLYPVFWDAFVQQKSDISRTILAVMPCNYSHYLAIEHVSWYYFRLLHDVSPVSREHYKTFLYYFKAKARLERVRGSLFERVIERKPDLVRNRKDFIDMEFSTDKQQTDMEKEQADIENMGKKGSNITHEKTLMVFATNTIANGLDIEAFNNMLIFGFPNKISEYVQVKGRIARKNNAGLCTIFLSQKNFRETSVFYDFHNFHENMDLAMETATINREADGVIESMIRKLFHLSLQWKYDSPTEPFYNRSTIYKIMGSQERLDELRDIVYDWFSFENSSRDISRRIFNEKWTRYVEDYKKWLESTKESTIYSNINVCLPQPSLLDISAPIQLKLSPESTVTATYLVGRPLYEEEPNETGDDELGDTEVGKQTNE